MPLTFCTSVAKGLKLKVRKFWELNLTFVEVKGRNPVGGPSILNREFTAIQTTGNGDLVKKADYGTKIEKLEKKIPNHDKYITAENDGERLKQVNLASKNENTDLVKNDRC